MPDPRRPELARAVPKCTARAHVRRVAMLSMHTSPLAQPGTGDAGGMNVYIMRTAEHLADLGIEVEIFTRATSSDQPPFDEVRPGVAVHHVPAGPFEGLPKHDLPSQMCAFTAGLLRAEARRPAGHFDAVHSHYWLSGQAGWLASERWGVPLVHSAHTLAKVKNRDLAAGDAPEPFARVVGEEQVAAESHALVANTPAEAAELVGLYDADPAKVTTSPPGVDTAVFYPGSQAEARAALGLSPDASVLGFVGRIQPLKAPDVLVRALARMRRTGRHNSRPVQLLIAGGQSGDGNPQWLHKLAAELGVADTVHFLPPRSGAALAQVYRACDVLGVPSHNETFGLVALEAQACGTPVVAADVGGLATAVQNKHSGILVDGHDPGAWAEALDPLLQDAELRQRLARGGPRHAAQFTWGQTAKSLLATYRRAAANRPTARRGVENPCR